MLHLCIANPEPMNIVATNHIHTFINSDRVTRPINSMSSTSDSKSNNDSASSDITTLRVNPPTNLPGVHKLLLLLSAHPPHGLIYGMISIEIIKLLSYIQAPLIQRYYSN